MKIWSLLLAALMASPAPTHGRQPVEESRVPLYDCRLDQHPIHATKMFREDGTVYSMDVGWVSNDRDFVRPSTYKRLDELTASHSFANLGWYGGNQLGHEYVPFDWSKGSISMTSVPVAPVRPFGEFWKQIFVDRNHSMYVLEYGGVASLAYSSQSTQLSTDLGAGNAAQSMVLPVNALLAWGAGADSISVYYTQISHDRRAREHESPIRERRIVGAFEVDIPALQSLISTIRSTVEKWEAGLEKSWDQCKRTPNILRGDIVATGG